MNVKPAAELLLLLSIANGTPVIAKLLFGSEISGALDGGRRLADGRFVFGPSKTIRGLVLSLAMTAVAGAALGLALYTGFVIALGAMAGDLMSSFAKRRLGLEPSSRATGLDQIPEALLPSLLASIILPLTASDIAAIVIIFFFGEILLSRIFFWVGLRDRPY
jgi:CDP-diglyceride synthetase